MTTTTLSGNAAGADTTHVEVQFAVSGHGLPTADRFRHWVRAALSGRREAAEVVVRVVDEAESAQLNETYRGKSGPTNVLSFPFSAPPGVASDLLGDIVICAPVVAREAHAQSKPEAAHWAHMVVHGVLHLLGFDHQTDRQAGQMESLERRIMDELGFADPYA